MTLILGKIEDRRRMVQQRIRCLKNIWQPTLATHSGPTKVRLVKAMVFPVVMYGCESWTVKKAELKN